MSTLRILTTRSLNFAAYAVVESAWGAVPVLPSVRFPRPLSEPAVRVSTQRALYGIYRQAGCATVQGLGIVLPR